MTFEGEDWTRHDGMHSVENRTQNDQLQKHQEPLVHQCRMYRQHLRPCGHWSRNKGGSLSRDRERFDCVDSFPCFWVKAPTPACFKGADLISCLFSLYAYQKKKKKKIRFLVLTPTVQWHPHILHAIIMVRRLPDAHLAPSQTARNTEITKH